MYRKIDKRYVIILMKCMIYSSKYEAILKILLAVPGRVGMEECSLEWIFLLGTARPFGFLMWEALLFFLPTDETRFS